MGFTSLPSQQGPALKPRTFAPTALRLQSYPWKNDDNQFAETGTQENSRLNTLCYLEVTNPEKKLPDGPNATIPWSGNFAPEKPPPAGLSDEDLAQHPGIPLGSFAMTKKNFMDGYLIRRLKNLIQAMVFTVTDLKVMGTWDSGYDMLVHQLSRSY